MVASSGPRTSSKPLLGLHPQFKSLEDLLRNGMSYHYKVELSEEERIRRTGSHPRPWKPQVRNSREAPQVLLLLTKDVTHGFSVPIPVESIHPNPGGGGTTPGNGHPDVRGRPGQTPR